MKRRDFVIGVSALAATPAQAQQATPAAPAAVAPAPAAPAVPTPAPTVAAPPAPAPAPAAPAAEGQPSGPPPIAPGVVRVAMRTGYGVMLIDLYRDKAPITVANFLKYVDAKQYDSAVFYRASRPAKDADGSWGSIQGGLQNKRAAPFKPIAHESTAKTGLSHLNGTISMTRNAPGTATSDFFIVLGDQTGYDADPAKKEAGFAAFGRVVDGIEVAKKIDLAKRSPTAGVGFMKGEMLSPTIPIVSVRRVAK
jgi:peptidyl-prolyl cis-trans isomerase A (cyclophilin A)